MYKNSKILLILIAFLFIFSIFMPMTVNADSYTCTLCGGQHEVGEIDDYPLAAFAYKVECIANGTFDNIEGVLGETGSKDSLMNILRFDTSAGGAYGDLMVKITGYYNSIAIIALLIIVLYFFLDLMETSLNEGFTYESFAKYCIKIIIAFVVIENGLNIISFGIDVCNAIFDVIAPEEGKYLLEPIYNGVSNCVYGTLFDPDAMIKVNPINCIATIFGSLIPCIAVLLAYILLRVTVWVRVFDIVVRIIFAPIGMSDILHGGLQAPGIKYFKKLMASVLNGACIVAVLLCYQTIRPALVGTLDASIANVALGFAVIALTRKTQGIANEIMGVD